MSRVRVALCSCGTAPQARCYRAGEDLMEAVAQCPACGLAADPVEHVWGGEEALRMAYAEWNRMRREDPDRKPRVPCPDCGGVGAAIVETPEGPDHGPRCTPCEGRGTLEKVPSRRASE